MKYPLYEAVETSGNLLFGVAKQPKNELFGDRNLPKEKNCIAVYLQKHSGQSQKLVISNRVLEKFDELLSTIRTSNKEDILLSAAQKIYLYRKLLDIADDERTVANLFENIFDADFHKGQKEDFLQKTLPGFFMESCDDDSIIAFEDGKVISGRAYTLYWVLKMMKFFVEKGGQ